MSEADDLSIEVKGRTLGVPQMDDTVPLASDEEEIKHEDGSISVRKGGVSRAEVEKKVRGSKQLKDIRDK